MTRKLVEGTSQMSSAEKERHGSARAASLAQANHGLRLEVQTLRQREAELRKKLEQLNDLVENGPFSLHWLGQDGTILWANRAELELLGYTWAEYVGHHLTEFHADREVPDDILKRLTRNETLHDYEVRLRSKDGSIRHVLLTSNALYQNGQFIHARCFTRDITARRQREEALRQTYGDLEARVEARTDELMMANARLEAEVNERKRADHSLGIKAAQLQAVTDSMLAFLETGNWRQASSLLIGSALAQTGSVYGFIGVVAEGPVLRILAHEGIVWDSSINRAFFENALRTYEERGYLEFANFENLFGRVITSGQSVISNSPRNDPRSGGLPPGHPPLSAFLGVPILRGKQVVGMIGVANRQGGYTGKEERQIQILSRAAGVLYDSYRRRERETKLEEQRKRAENELKNTYNRLRELTLRLEAIREEERRRIALELHDEFGRALTCLMFDLSWMKKRIARTRGTTGRSELLEKIRSMSSMVGSSMQTMHRLCASLRLSILDDLGLPAALEWLAKDFEARSGIHRCALAVSPRVAQMEIEPARSLALFRAAQELLTNVMRHAHASRVHISLTEEAGVLVLQVSDDGIGITVPQIPSPTSLGLRGIRERASLLGGQCTVHGQSGTGTTVTVRIPLR